MEYLYTTEIQGATAGGFDLAKVQATLQAASYFGMPKMAADCQAWATQCGHGAAVAAMLEPDDENLMRDEDHVAELRATLATHSNVQQQQAVYSDSKRRPQQFIATASDDKVYTIRQQSSS